MPDVLVDSNLVIDLLDEAAAWHGWARKSVAECAVEGALAVNPVVFAEVCIPFETEALAAAAIDFPFFRRETLPWSAAFHAGQAFGAYKRRGGVRIATLPDFFIGAHARVAGYALLTRDARRYRTYFPDVRLIAPD